MDELTCIHCGAPLSESDIDSARGLVKCSHCDSVYRLPGWKPPRERPRVPLPERFRVERTDVSLEISWRWFSAKFVFLVFFCVAWDSFLAFWYGVALTQRGVPWIAVVFPIGHLAVGAGLSYYTLAGFVNRTRILVDRRRIAVRHGPLPWWGAVELPSQEVDQLYAVQRTRRTQNGTSVSYRLMALSRDGRSRRVLSGLDEADQALALEAEIEDWLGIADRPVEGEIRR